MSTLTSSSAAPTAGDRVRHWAPRLVAVVVLGWSETELVGLIAAGHTIGPELYGLLVAVLAVGAAGATVWLLLSSRPRIWVAVGIVALWAVIAIGGLAGVVAHAVGPDPNHGPVDDRPRPASAPLAFTALGLLGAGALTYDTRRRSRNRS